MTQSLIFGLSHCRLVGGFSHVFFFKSDLMALVLRIKPSYLFFVFTSYMTSQINDRQDQDTFRGPLPGGTLAIRE